jgi:hypothetical protein
MCARTDRAFQIGQASQKSNSGEHGSVRRRPWRTRLPSYDFAISALDQKAGAERQCFSARSGPCNALRPRRLLHFASAPTGRLSDVRARSPLFIEELLALVQPGIRPALEPHLPSGLVVRGCQGASRRSPHALFALLLADPRAATAVRHWLAMSLLTELLPTLPTSVEGRLACLLRCDVR